ncbi:MAG: FAD-dependent oxidoreductase [bacterium]
MASSYERCREGRALTRAGASEPRSLRRLVLVGGGRAHLELLRAFAQRVLRGVEIVLVAEEVQTFSSAMAVGLLRGVYALEDARIDVARLAERAGVRLVTGRVSTIELGEQIVVSGTNRVAFDACSLDVVGVPDEYAFRGVLHHALLLQHASTLPGARTTLYAWLADVGRRVNCVVVGGGTTGVEAAFAMQHLLNHSKHGGLVTIVDSASGILGDSPCRDPARRALERIGVCFALGSRAVEISSEAVLLSSGAALPADVAVWAAPGSPLAAIAASGLPHDAHGRLLVDAHLRARDGAPVWAAGQCAARSDAGERAVDESLVLERALRTALGASSALALPRTAWSPCLLDTGDGRALVAWGALHAHARWGWWLKQRRDRGFVAELAQA